MRRALHLCDPLRKAHRSLIPRKTPGKPHKTINHSIISDSLQPHGLKPTYLWNSPGKNTGVGSQPFPSPGDLPDPGIELGSPALQADFFFFLTIWATREVNHEENIRQTQMEGQATKQLTNPPPNCQDHHSPEEPKETWWWPNAKWWSGWGLGPAKGH